MYGEWVRSEVDHKSTSITTQGIKVSWQISKISSRSSNFFPYLSAAAIFVLLLSRFKDLIGGFGGSDYWVGREEVHEGENERKEVCGEQTAEVNMFG